MLERINGFSESGVLGYFYGKNALVSLAVANAGNVVIAVTGAPCSYAGVLHFLNTDDKDVITAFLNEKGITRVDGTPFVEATVEVDYTAAFAAQTNMKRVVDVIQQRAVILSTSLIAQAVDVAGWKNAPNGISGAAAVDGASALTFLIERADVFDRDATTFQGVPTISIDQGRLLIDDLTGVPFMTSTGGEVRLESSATAAAAGNFAIKIHKQIPALLD